MLIAKAKRRRTKAGWGSTNKAHPQAASKRASMAKTIKRERNVYTHWRHANKQASQKGIARPHSIPFAKLSATKK